MSNISRRQFLKGAGVATLAVAADIQLPDGYKLSTDYGTEEELLKVRPFDTVFIVTKL